MQVAERWEDECVSGGQRVQRAMIMKLSAAANVVASIQRHNDRYIGAFVVMPSALNLFCYVVVSNLYRLYFCTVALVEAPEDRVEHVLHDEPHGSVQLWNMLSEHDFGDLAQDILVLIGLETDLFAHVL